MSSEELASLAASRAIQSLAEQSNTPAEVVEDLYRQELNELEPARVRQFLSVIASRRVRERLRTTPKVH